jgi:hypothetical protein
MERIVGKTFKQSNWLHCNGCHKKTLFRQYVNGFEWIGDKKYPKVVFTAKCQKCAAIYTLKLSKNLYDKNKYDYLKKEK